jgi:hypothetical protein
VFRGCVEAADGRNECGHDVEETGVLSEALQALNRPSP